MPKGLKSLRMKRIIAANLKRKHRIYKSLNLQRQRPRINKKKIILSIPLTESLFKNLVLGSVFFFESLTDGSFYKRPF